MINQTKILFEKKISCAKINRDDIVTKVANKKILI